MQRLLRLRYQMIHTASRWLVNDRYLTFSYFIPLLYFSASTLFDFLLFWYYNYVFLNPQIGEQKENLSNHRVDLYPICNPAYGPYRQVARPYPLLIKHLLVDAYINIRRDRTTALKERHGLDSLSYLRRRFPVGSHFNTVRAPLDR